MAGWTDSSPTSRVFTQALLSPMIRAFDGAGGAAAPSFVSLTADVVKAALFNNTTSPDASAALTSTLYNTGVWVTANEVIDVTNWVAGGRAVTLTTPSVTAAGSQTTPSTVSVGASNLAGGGTLTITNAYGCLVYDSTITGTPIKQGMCFNYFGGPQTVTGGTFTIVWDATGVFKFTN